MENKTGIKGELSAKADLAGLGSSAVCLILVWFFFKNFFFFNGLQGTHRPCSGSSSGAQSGHPSQL